MCRTDCELLENEICEREYAIAKRHPVIGQILPIEDCNGLDDGDDCLNMGIDIDIRYDDTCYWDNGADYRGIKDRTLNNKVRRRKKKKKKKKKKKSFLNFPNGFFSLLSLACDGQKCQKD
jgi:hypothetical protein